MEIRSYRTVFDLERRIYRIDRVRLNPAGVPVRGVVYFLALAALLALIATLPGIGLILATAPWYLREIALPAGLAALLVVLRIDGRPFHLAALSILGQALSPRTVTGCGRPVGATCWSPDDLLLLPDGSDARVRRLSYAGPGAVLITVAHERRELRCGALARLAGRPQLLLCQLPGRCMAKARLIELADGARVQLR
ncbi:MAG: hypothetical protein WAU69_16460 [Solirubrobacteraceae bacterium]